MASDLGDRHSRYPILSEQGEVVSRHLAQWGREVIVANPRKVALIARSRQKDDQLDAEKRARLGRIDPQLLGPIRRRGQQAQADLAPGKHRRSKEVARTKWWACRRPTGSPLTPAGLLMEAASVRERLAAFRPTVPGGLCRLLQEGGILEAAWRKGRDVEERLRRLMQELGNAINGSLSESDRIAEVIGEIKQAGYDVFLVLEATIGFNRRDEAGEEDVPAEAGRERRSGRRRDFSSSTKFRWTSQDQKFLKALRISLEEDTR